MTEKIKEFLSSIPSCRILPLPVETGVLLARQCAGLTDCEVTDTAPSLASEDYALYRAHVPSFFYWVGSAAKEEPRAEEPHRPCFHTDDHALAWAAELLAVSAIKAGRA